MLSFVKSVLRLMSMSTIDASSSSCPASVETVKLVESCPKTEEKWREAAERKNCFQYASKCDEPRRLEYHCLINPYLNQTLEVCAYPQTIVHSTCSEYSSEGNIIQSNYDANCTSCPPVYSSNKAFIYELQDYSAHQECYRLVKKSANTKASPPTAISPKTDNVANAEFPNTFIISITIVITLFCFKEQIHIHF